MCRVLLETGARAFPQALHNAILSGNWETIDLFMDAGYPKEAMRLAAERGTRLVLDRLFPRHPKLAGTALHGAISGCRYALARKLLDNGADPNARGPNGRTPIMSTYVIDRRRDLFRFMLADPDRNMPDWGCEPWKAREKMPVWKDFDRDDSMKFNVLNRPVNWNELLDLSDEDAWEFFRELTAQGADMDARECDGRTVLRHACAQSWLKSIPFRMNSRLSSSISWARSMALSTMKAV